MPKVTLSRDDIFHIYMKDGKETIEWFGEDYLEDFGVEVPQDLIDRYKAAYEQFQKVQDELFQIYKNDRSRDR